MPARPLAFSRRDDGRLLAGVAGGFADQHGADAVVVRTALVLLSFAAGLGVVVYAGLALLASAPGTPMPAPHARDYRRNLAVGVITLGLMLVMRSAGLWLGDELMLPLIVIGAGFAVLGVVRTDERRGEEGSERTGNEQTAVGLVALSGERFGAARIAVGTSLVALGLLLVGLNQSVSSGIRIGAAATAITVVGVALLLGPWIVHNARSAAEARRERIRAAEREAMAAHLHDSVLQTLALIQRTADDPRRTVMLARRQEAELREWLYGTLPGSESTVAGAVRAMAADVETSYQFVVEVVVVGDAPLDERCDALVGALREACVNAAKHSGTASVSVYVEVDANGIEAFARDRGEGFDPSVSRPDRRGISQSIVGRMERVGGTAEVESQPGAGTEVRLSLPLVTSEQLS